MLAAPLSEEEVEQLSALLTDGQKRFLDSYVKQSKKSRWLEKLARKKGIVLQPGMGLDDAWQSLQDWELREVLDGGYGNRPYTCECGKALRFCFVVHHRARQQTYQLGITCLAHYTMLSSDLIQDISRGFHTIDLERDEILIRNKQGWKLPKRYAMLPFTERLQTQIALGLPLSDAQLKKMEQALKQDQASRRASRHTAKPQRRAASREEPAADSEVVSYAVVMDRHAEQLALIRAHEQRLNSAKMKAKWADVQRMAEGLQQGKPVGYSDFLVPLFELLYHLKLY